MTLPEFQKRMAALNDAAQNGCRDSGCRIKKPTGMATNGGCRCSPLGFADALSDFAKAVTVLGRRNWEPVLPNKDEAVSHRTLKWLWIMDYCKKNGLAPAQKWAWDLAELKWEAAHPFNWRECEVCEETYIGAIGRHLGLHLEGEEVDAESRESHLAHVAANCKILMDAEGCGTLVRRSS